MRFAPALRSTLALLASAAVLSCGGSPTAPGRVSVAAVEVAPPAATIAVGGTRAFTATTVDAQGQTLAGRTIFWASEDETVATVSGSGVVSGLKAGTTRIAASSEGRSAYAQVEISPRRVHSVSVVPPAPQALVNGTVRLRAIAYDSTGAELTGRDFVWATSNQIVATVERGPTADSAVVTGRAAGTATITATSEGQTGDAALTVSAAPVNSVTLEAARTAVRVGEQIPVTAVVRDAEGNVLTGRSISWSTSNSSVATVTQQGVVSAAGAGSAVITATAENRSGTITFTVTQRPVISVSVSPQEVSLFVGGTQQMTATARDSADQILTGRATSWSSNNNAVAEVSGGGLVTAKAPGSATITATVEGVANTATVTVTLVPVASVTVTPDGQTIAVGQKLEFAAVPRDAGGNALTGRAVTWSSSQADVASVAPNGEVTGVSAGTVTITATVEGVDGSAQLTVTDPSGGSNPGTPIVVPDSVEVTPKSVSLSSRHSETAQLTARVFDKEGRPLEEVAVAWSSDNNGVATVNQTGLVTARSPGSATITASAGPASGTAQVSVNAGN